MTEFVDKTVLVTGGAGHIGRAICEYFLDEGADVIACGRREPEQLISSGGRVARFISVDIRDPVASQALINTIVSDCGGLDVLVNNAGGSPPVDAANASPGLTEKIIQLNLLAPLVLSQQAHDALHNPEQPGVIINIASVSGARPSPGTTAYGAAKAGLLSATRSLAMEWGPGIRVNAIIVGLVYHEAGIAHYGGEEGFNRVADMLPLKRMAVPADVAKAVMFLSSERAAYVSGAALELDGGGEVPVFLHLAKEAAQRDA